MSSRHSDLLAPLAMLVLSACGARTDLSVYVGTRLSDAGVPDAPSLSDVGGPDTAPRNDATSGCGGSGEPCCGGGVCVTSLSCMSGVCTAPRTGVVVLFGGRAPHGGDLSDTWIFDGTSWSELSVPEAPPARDSAGMATLGSRVVLFGGFKSATLISDTWMFDGTSWTEVHGSPHPPSVDSMAALGGQVTVYTGSPRNPYAGGGGGDTWTFDGTSWTLAPTHSGPSARIGSGLATLGTEDILFGGADDDHTWAFDGTRWSQLKVSTHPGSLGSPGMATLGGEVVLFGGQNDLGNDVDDTWTFDGTVWSQLPLSSRPPARESASAATLGGRVVLFGGEHRGTYFNDTWTFDGTTWSQLTIPSPPSERFAATMAFLP